MTTKTLLLFLQLALVTTALGCATEPAYSPFAAGDSGLAKRESARQVAMLPNANAMILEPGENIRIRGLHTGRYICSDGEPLVCNRIGLTAYCSCPGNRKRW
jgi:hypothetical protein